MRNMNKSGLAPILQVTIISALSIISLMLVWGYVKDLSADFENQLSPAVDCITQRSGAESACVNQNGKIELTLDVALGESIFDLDANFKGESFSCGNSCGSCTILDSQGKKTVYLNNQFPAASQDSLGVAINRCLPEVLAISQC